MSIKIGILPDIHLGRKKINIFLWDYLANKKHNIDFSESVVGKEIEERLREAVYRLNSLKLDFVVLLGDISQDGSSCQLIKTREILDDLKVPYIPVVGGHDIKGGDLPISRIESFFKEKLTGAADYFEDWKKQGSEFQNYSFDYRETRFIVIDNNSRVDPAFWKLNEESKNWLLKRAKGKVAKIVVFSHIRLPLKTLKNLRTDEVQILNVSGHHHKIKKQNKEKVTRIFVNSLFLEPRVPILNLNNLTDINFKKI